MLKLEEELEKKLGIRKFISILMIVYEYYGLSIEEIVYLIFIDRGRDSDRGRGWICRLLEGLGSLKISSNLLQILFGECAANSAIS